MSDETTRIPLTLRDGAAVLPCSCVVHHFDGKPRSESMAGPGNFTRLEGRISPHLHVAAGCPVHGAHATAAGAGREAVRDPSVTQPVLLRVLMAAGIQEGQAHDLADMQARALAAAPAPAQDAAAAVMTITCDGCGQVVSLQGGALVTCACPGTTWTLQRTSYAFAQQQPGAQAPEGA